MAPQNNYNSSIKDHGPQITITNITMKKFEMLWELPKCDTKTRNKQMQLEKWGVYTWSIQGCHEPSVGKNCEAQWKEVCL